MNEKINMYSYLWEIENFTLHYHTHGEYISSPSFTFGNLNCSEWFLNLFPKGEQVWSDYISIFLHRDDDIEDEDILIDYKIEAIDGNGEILNIFNDKNKVFKGKQRLGLEKFIRWEDLINKICDWKTNILTISCELSSKEANKLYLSRCEARTKIGFSQLAIEKFFNLSEPFSWTFDFSPVPIKIIFQDSSDHFQMAVLRFAKIAEGSVYYRRMIMIRISLLDVNGLEDISKLHFHKFKSSSSKDFETWKFPSFFSRAMLLDKKDTLLHKNEFTLKCEVSLPNEITISTIKNCRSYISEATKTMSEADTFLSLHDNLHGMLVSKKYCDVKFQVEGISIPAHKALLAARSEVFSTMFDQDMLESKTGIIDIQDMTVSAMNSLLEFIYTGTVKDIDYEKALELLMAGEKYQVLSLKQKCSSFLISAFSESNVCDVLTTANMIGYWPLKTAAMDYIKQKYKKIMSASNWVEWIKMNNELATEIILQMSNRIK